MAMLTIEMQELIELKKKLVIRQGSSVQINLCCLCSLCLCTETRTWQVGAGLWGEAVRGLAAVQLGSVVMGFGVPAFKSYGALRDSHLMGS